MLLTVIFYTIICPILRRVNNVIKINQHILISTQLFVLSYEQLSMLLTVASIH